MSPDKPPLGVVDQHGRPYPSSQAPKQHHPDSDPQEDPANKEAKTPFGQRGLRAAIIVFELAGFVAIWQASHGLALAVGVGIVAWEIWPMCRSMGRWFPVLAAIIAVGAGVVGEKLFPTPTDSTHGWLKPGTQPSPPIKCFAEGSLGVYLGGSGAGSIGINRDRFCAIEIGGRRVLEVHRQGSEIAISARIFDQSGLVARIDRNEFRSNRLHEPLRMDVPDNGTLIVRDWLGDPLVTVRYLNPEALYVTGVFFVPGYTPIVVNETGIHMTNDRHMWSTCLRTAGDGCAISWGEKQPFAPSR